VVSLNLCHSAVDGHLLFIVENCCRQHEKGDSSVENADTMISHFAEKH